MWACLARVSTTNPRNSLPTSLQVKQGVVVTPASGAWRRVGLVAAYSASSAWRPPPLSRSVVVSPASGAWRRGFWSLRARRRSLVGGQQRDPCLALPRYAEIEKLCVHPFSPPAPRFKTPELVAVAVALFLPISADSTSSARIPPRRMCGDSRLLNLSPSPSPCSSDDTPTACASPSTPVRRFRTSARVAVAVALLLARYADLDKLRVHPFSPPARDSRVLNPSPSPSPCSCRYPPTRQRQSPRPHFCPSTPVRRFKTSGRVAVAVAVALLLARYADLDKISAVGNKQVWQDTSQSSSESW
ncbi:hypothetical protein B0H11DRAFT_2235558 [Mycena galericulata]|nr:hypothetical protein B0H11DRAFT_2235558 [Mycena galericulata]